MVAIMEIPQHYDVRVHLKTRPDSSGCSQYKIKYIVRTLSLINKMNNENTTLSEQFQNLISKS